VGLVHFRYQVSRRTHRSGRLQRFTRRDNGFTLTELVIAMVVLSILSSIAIPSFLGSRNNSYDKEAQSSIEVVLRAAKFHYQSQGDFSDASSAQCGDSTGLAADLQKLEPNVDVVASSVSSTNARIISVQAVQTWSSNAELLGCQGFYAVALSSSGSCWAARIILEGKYLASGSVSPVAVNTQTNTSNNAVTTWSALAVNGNAFGVLKPQTSAADGDNTNGLVAIKNACKAKTQSTGVATTSSNYIAPSQFYATWRDVTSGGVANSSSSSSSVTPALTCATGGTCAYLDPGPSGGTVFYVQPLAGTFASPGSTCNTAGVGGISTCKYLEAAPIGWITETQTPAQTNCGASGGTNGTSTDDPVCKWSANSTVLIGTTASGLGAGRANTVAMIGQSGGGSTLGYAASAADAYRGGGYTDWFLGSALELNEFCKYGRNQTTGDITVSCNSTGSLRTGIRSPSYWMSTEIDLTTSRYQNTSNGSQGNAPKTTPSGVRPIRAFG
jgi:prepilin-type N-terminal cleavage/methylation domain-containing protein